uniref:Uncharacterized protein n=1 Tax=Anguilla anguilla TaxID=7936 RepID=A0A0E9R731_ANGAN
MVYNPNSISTLHSHGPLYNQFYFC